MKSRIKLLLSSLVVCLLILSGCKKTTEYNFLHALQGTWTSSCGCIGHGSTSYKYYKISGDSIYASNNDTTFVIDGYIGDTTAYFICDMCMPAGIEYHPFPLVLSNNGQSLQILSNCTTVANCPDSAYHKVN